MVLLWTRTTAFALTRYCFPTVNEFVRRMNTPSSYKSLGLVNFDNRCDWKVIVGRREGIIKQRGMRYFPTAGLEGNFHSLSLYFPEFWICWPLRSWRWRVPSEWEETNTYYRKERINLKEVSVVLKNEVDSTKGRGYKLSLSISWFHLFSLLMMPHTRSACLLNWQNNNDLRKAIFVITERDTGEVYGGTTVTVWDRQKCTNEVVRLKGGWTSADDVLSGRPSVVMCLDINEQIDQRVGNNRRISPV
jgi:hypothetical protein